jgi:hypothetical protein
MAPLVKVRRHIRLPVQGAYYFIIFCVIHDFYLVFPPIYDRFWRMISPKHGFARSDLGRVPWGLEAPYTYGDSPEVEGRPLTRPLIEARDIRLKKETFSFCEQKETKLLPPSLLQTIVTKILTIP